MAWPFQKDPKFKEIIKYVGKLIENGFITLSEKPEIGVEINEEGMKKYATPGVPVDGFFEQAMYEEFRFV